MPSYVNISKPVLDWISSSVSMDDFSEEAKGYLESWIKGKKATYDQIVEVSESTGIPLGYFLMKTAPKEDLSFTEYRTVTAGTPSRNLIETIQTMEMIQEWTREYLVEDGFEPVNYVGKTPSTITPVEFAAEMRKVLGIEENWFTRFESPDSAYEFLRAAISNACVLVMQNGIAGHNPRRFLDIHEFRSFSLVDEYAPLIFINTNDSVQAKTFALLYEYAHIFVGVRSVYNADQYEEAGSPLETLCYRTAAEIFVPQGFFAQKWNELHASTDTNKSIRPLLREFQFQCSPSVILRRALDSKFISRAEYQNAVSTVENETGNKAAIETKHTGEGDCGKLASTFDHQFLAMLITGVQTGRTSYSEAFRMTGTKLGSFQKLIEYIEAEEKHQMGACV